MSTSEKDSMIGKRIPKSGHITTPEDRRNKLNPQKNLVSTTEENAVDLGNSGPAVKPTVTVSSPSGGRLESSSPALSGGVVPRILPESSSLVTVSSPSGGGLESSSPALSGGVVPRILPESSSLVTFSSPSGGGLESSSPVTGCSLSGSVVPRILPESSSLVNVSSSQICSSCSGLGVVPQGTPPQQSLDRRQANFHRGNFHNLIWMCRFIFDGILLTCLERYGEQFADSGEKILVVFMCYWATTVVWMKLTDGVHQGFSAIMEWASIILKMTALIYVKILELMGCNDIILFVIKCLLAIAINWLTHMALHQ